MTAINQKEYLKKYLGLGRAPGEKKKKKKDKSGPNRLKIIDDDVDVNISQEIEADISGANEDAPQIVAVIDERPPSLRIDEKTRNLLWKPIGETSEANIDLQNLKLSSFKIGRQVKDTNLNKLSLKSKYASEIRNKESRSTSGKKIKDSSRRRHSNDLSPARGKSSEDISSPKSKHDGYSPPRRKDDNSPPRRREDNSPPRRRRHDDGSPSRTGRVTDLSPPRRKYGSEDLSPRRRRDTSEDLSPPRTKRSIKSDISPKRSREDDFSPKRKRRIHQSEDDLSPKRKRGSSEDLSPRRQRQADDLSPPRRKRNVEDDNTPPRLKIKKERSDDSPRRKSREGSYSQKKSRWSDSSPKSSSSKTSSEKMTKTLDGKKAGLQNAKDLVRETILLKEREDAMFRNMSADVSGANAATVSRKNQQPKDLEAEAQKLKKEKETKEKYDRWGKGLKQIESEKERFEEQLHEMSKPLARYADDEDLERYLKEQEREGDPMLAYIRKKKRKEAVAAGIPEKPMYMGEFLPNRFGIPPGYRWDGVDRSNGYEKKYFQIQNSKRANQEEAFKWSTEDM